MPQPRFPTTSSDHWGVISPIFQQGVTHHEKCIVYKHLWEETFPTHRLNLSRWQIFLKLAKFVFSLQSVFVTIQFNSPPTIIVADSERSNYGVHILKTFSLLAIRWSRQLRQYDTIPRPDGNSVIGYFYYLSGEHGITTYVYALYPLIRSISIGVNSCKSITSVSCLWRNSVVIGSLIIADMPLSFRVAMLCDRL